MRYLSVCIWAKGNVSLYHSINIRTFNNIDKSHIMKIKHRLRHQIYLSIISTTQTFFKTIKIFRSPDKPLYLLRHICPPLFICMTDLRWGLPTVSTQGAAKKKKNPQMQQMLKKNSAALFPSQTLDSYVTFPGPASFS